MKVRQTGRKTERVKKVRQMRRKSESETDRKIRVRQKGK